MKLKRQRYSISKHKQADRNTKVLLSQWSEVTAFFIKHIFIKLLPLYGAPCFWGFLEEAVAEGKCGLAPGGLVLGGAGRRQFRDDATTIGLVDEGCLTGSDRDAWGSVTFIRQH